MTLELDLPQLKAFFANHPDKYLEHVKKSMLDLSQAERFEKDNFIPSAVLIPFIQSPQGLSILFTKRASHLNHHAGQISFPGGRIDAKDKDARAAALREMEEEIGHPHDQIHILGQMPNYRTGTGFQITPIVGQILPPFDFVANHHEVAQIFEIPINHLFGKDIYKIETKIWKGMEVHFYSLQYQEHYIWGATAGILALLNQAILEFTNMTNQS